MKRMALGIFLAGLGLGLVVAADASHTTRATAKKTVVKETPPGPQRAVVVVNRGWPIRRAMPTVIVRPARAAVRVQPAVYLAPVVWRPIIVPSPAPEALIWEDGETIYRGDDWTEVTLNAHARGTRLFLEVERGKAQLQFAEVVFENGESRVVDFQENIRAQGLYPVLDFKNGRAVDHVRLVTRAKSDPTRLVLRLQA
jgi:hypothetical protein